jgi:hypothetical protein
MEQLIIVPNRVKAPNDNDFAHFSTGRDTVIPVDENHQSDSGGNALTHASVMNTNKTFELSQPG